MPKTSLRASLRLPGAIATLALLVGCGASAGNGSPASGTDGGNDKAQSDEACKNHPLLKAMPPEAAIDGLPFEYRDCTFSSVRFVYGKQHGKEMEVTIADTRSPDIDKQPAALHDFYANSGGSQRQMTQLAVKGSIATRQSAEASPQLVTITFGGPDYLPIVETTATGDPLAITVGAKGDHGEATAQALLKDRYVLIVQARDEKGTIHGLTAPQAQAIYEPFLKRLRLDRLQ